MQSVQRRFGKFLPRTADESQVAVLLKDFEDADKMLIKVPCAQMPLLSFFSNLVRRSSRRQKPGVTRGEIFSGHSNGWCMGFSQYTLQ